MPADFDKKEFVRLFASQIPFCSVQCLVFSVQLWAGYPHPFDR